MHASNDFIHTKIGRLEFRRLDRYDAAEIIALNKLLQSSSQYFLENNGSPVLPDAAQKLFSDMPNGKTERDKYLLALVDGAEIIAFADVIRGYPLPEVASIRLFLVAECDQGKGLGKAMLAQLDGLAASWNCNAFELGVCILNKKGIRFWRREGFKTLRTVPLPGYLSDAIVMRRAVSNPKRDVKNAYPQLLTIFKN